MASDLDTGEMAWLQGMQVKELSYRETRILAKKGANIISWYFRRIALGHGERWSGDLGYTRVRRAFLHESERETLMNV